MSVRPNSSQCQCVSYTKAEMAGVVPVSRSHHSSQSLGEYFPRRRQPHIKILGLPSFQCFAMRRRVGQPNEVCGAEF